MLLVALTLVTAAVAVGSYFLSGRSLVAPAVLFAAGFTLSGVFANLYAGPWGFELHADAFLAIAGGNAWFMVVAALTSWACGKCMAARPAPQGQSAPSAPEDAAGPKTESGRSRDAAPRAGFFRNATGKRPEHAGEADAARFLAPVRIAPAAAFLAVQAVVFALTLVFIQGLYPDQSLAAAIKSYNSASTFTTDAPSLPSWFNHVRMLATGGSYFVAYLVGQQLASGWRKRDLVLAASALLAVALILETGGRTSAVAYVVVAVVSYFVVRRRLDPDGGVPWKAVAVVAAVAVVLLATFKFAAVGGRGAEDRDPLEYLAMYLGGEIANLDAYLQGGGGAEHRELFGYMTFMRDWNYFGDKLGVDAWVYSPDLPFQYRGEYSLGNVYTTFYAFLYDFGVPGVVVLVAVMAAVSQLVFEKAANARPTKWMTIWIAVYAVLAFSLLMSFFSNKFYEDVLSVNFARNLLYLLVVRYLVCYFDPKALTRRLKRKAVSRDDRS